MLSHLKKPFSLFITCFLLCIACEKDESPETDFLGTWQIQQKTIDGQTINLSSCESNATIKFEDYNLCKLYDACADTTYNDTWSYTNGMINIASALPTAYNVESVSSSELYLSSYDFDSTGLIVLTELSYKKLD